MHIKCLNIAGLDLYLYLISQYAASWLNAYISNLAKNEQQIDLRTSGSNRKRSLSDSINVLPGIYQFMSLP